MRAACGYVSRNSRLAFPMSLSALTSSVLAALSSYLDARCADGSLKSVPLARADELRRHGFERSMELSCQACGAVSALAAAENAQLRVFTVIDPQTIGKEPKLRMVSEPNMRFRRGPIFDVWSLKPDLVLM